MTYWRRQDRGRDGDPARRWRSPVTVIGFVSDVSYSGQGSLWAGPGTWREVMAANRPDVQLPDDVFQALVVQADDDVDVQQLADEIDGATGTTESLTITDAIEEIPGVRAQRSTFNQIIGVTIAIAGVVVALFFALLTVERLSCTGCSRRSAPAAARCSPASSPKRRRHGRGVGGRRRPRVLDRRPDPPGSIHSTSPGAGC